MRLIACTICDRQYDVGRHDEGSRIRCVCGEGLTVVHHEPHEPRALRCPGCGAPFAPGSRHCEYCRVEIDPLQMRFTALCPHCQARMTEGASFCMDCGRAIAPQILVAIPEGRDCPRCAGALVSRRVENTSLVECGGCHGIWLPTESFEEACRRAEGRADLAAGLARHSGAGAAEGAPRQPFKYLPCIACGDMMVPRNFGGNSGVILDVCGRHGIWLDAGEFQAILRFLESGKERSDGARGSGLERAAPAPVRESPMPTTDRSAGWGGSFAAGGVETVVRFLLEFLLP